MQENSSYLEYYIVKNFYFFLKEQKFYKFIPRFALNTLTIIFQNYILQFKKLLILFALINFITFMLKSALGLFQIALELIYILRILYASCIDPITRRWRIIRFARESNVLKVVLSCSTERPTYSRDLSDFNRGSSQTAPSATTSWSSRKGPVHHPPNFVCPGRDFGVHGDFNPRILEMRCAVRDFSHFHAESTLSGSSSLLSSELCEVFFTSFFSLVKRKR